MYGDYREKTHVLHKLENAYAKINKMSLTIKKTPQEVADFLGRPIAKDTIVGETRWFWYEDVPRFISNPDWQFNGWTSTKKLQALPPNLIKFDKSVSNKNSLFIPKKWKRK